MSQQRSVERARYEQRISELEARLAAAERREMQTLVAYYKANSADCARFCDEDLDPTGATLGRVRDAVAGVDKPA